MLSTGGFLQHCPARPCWTHHCSCVDTRCQTREGRNLTYSQRCIIATIRPIALLPRARHALQPKILLPPSSISNVVQWIQLALTWTLDLAHPSALNLHLRDVNADYLEQEAIHIGVVPIITLHKFTIRTRGYRKQISRHQTRLPKLT